MSRKKENKDMTFRECVDMLYNFDDDNKKRNVDVYYKKEHIDNLVYHMPLELCFNNKNTYDNNTVLAYAWNGNSLVIIIRQIGE